MSLIGRLALLACLAAPACGSESAQTEGPKMRRLFERHQALVKETNEALAETARLRQAYGSGDDPDAEFRAWTKQLQRVKPLTDELYGVWQAHHDGVRRLEVSVVSGFLSSVMRKENPPQPRSALDYEDERHSQQMRVERDALFDAFFRENQAYVRAGKKLRLHKQRERRQRRLLLGAGLLALAGLAVIGFILRPPAQRKATGALPAPQRHGTASLAGLLRARRRLPWPEALGIFRQACASLAETHALKVVHQDVKPENILLSPSGRAKVQGVGLKGTPAYMAPEQELAALSPAVDLYALTVCFYEMLTGDLPFRGPDFLAEKRAGRYRPPSRLVDGLPPGVDAFFKAALAPEPDRRFPTAAALSAAAKRAL